MRIAIRACFTVGVLSRVARGVGTRGGAPGALKVPGASGRAYI